MHPLTHVAIKISMEENTPDVREENEEDSNSESYSSESEVETEVTNRQVGFLVS